MFKTKLMTAAALATVAAPLMLWAADDTMTNTAASASAPAEATATSTVTQSTTTVKGKHHKHHKPKKSDSGMTAPATGDNTINNGAPSHDTEQNR